MLCVQHPMGAWLGAASHRPGYQEVAGMLFLTPRLADAFLMAIVAQPAHRVTWHVCVILRVISGSLHSCWHTDKLLQYQDCPSYPSSPSHPRTCQGEFGKILTTDQSTAPSFTIVKTSANICGVGQTFSKFQDEKQM